MNSWMTKYCRRMQDAFAGRIRFIGLQGSRARDEASENSDIDVICILDELRPADVVRYRKALEDLERRKLVCGFLSGWDELMHWDAADLFMFYHDTVPYIGSLDALKDRIDTAAVERAIHTGAGNIYHGCVHNMVHERDQEMLKGLYKSAAFVLRAAVYLRTGTYAHRTDVLLQNLDGADRKILQTAMALKDGADVDFENMSNELFCWAQRFLK